jgi:hypothetical protein
VLFGIPVKDAQYYLIEQHRNDVGQIHHYSTYSHCVGKSMLRPDWEVREASLMNPTRVIEMYSTMRRDLRIVNTDSDASAFLLAGGVGLVEKSIADDLFCNLILPTEVAPGVDGYSSVNLESMVKVVDDDHLDVDSIKTPVHRTDDSEPVSVRTELMEVLDRCAQLRWHVDMLANRSSRITGRDTHFANSYARTLSLAYISTGLNHLSGVRSLCEDESTLDPRFTLLRTAFESALISYWILDPAADDWLCRGYAAALGNLIERRKFEQSLDVSHAAHEIDELLIEIDRLGFLEQAVEAGRRLRAKVPSTVDLTKTYLRMCDSSELNSIPSDWLFRFMAGCSHGMSWSLALTDGLVNPLQDSVKSTVWTAAIAHHQLAIVERSRQLLVRSISSIDRLDAA